MSAKTIDLGLTRCDELFMTDKERAENRLPKIQDIPIAEINDFPDHPFHVRLRLDTDMNELVQNVKERGIITPITLWQKEDRPAVGCLWMKPTTIRISPPFPRCGI